MTRKKTYKVNGMHCVSCAMLIEGELEDRGVKASCNYARSEVAVEYDSGKLEEKEIHEAVKALGYTLAN